MIQGELLEMMLNQLDKRFINCCLHSLQDVLSNFLSLRSSQKSENKGRMRLLMCFYAEETAHTTFKFPIDLDTNKTPVCAVSRNSDKTSMF